MLRRWRLILRYLPPYRGAIVLGMASLVVANIALVVAPVLLSRGIAAIEKPWRAGEPVEPWRVASMAALALLATAIGGIASYLKRHRLMRTSRRAETDLRHDLFEHIQQLPLKYFDHVRTGDLMSRATADIEAARLGMGPGMMYLLDSLLGFGFALVAMLSTSVAITLWALIPLAGVCGGLFFLAPRIHLASRAVQDHLASLSARAQESFGGARVVKTFATEHREQATMEKLSRDYLEANVQLARVRAFTMAWISLMGAGGLAIVLFLGGAMVMRGELLIAELLLFQSLQLMLIWPMMAFGWVLSMVQRGTAGLERIAEVMDIRRETDIDAETAPVRGDVALRDLRFAYDGTPVLRGIDLEIPAGATVGVLGPTGSGKSTLVALLARLYDPPRGTVFVDGTDVHDLPLDRLRGAVAFVPQEPFLFSKTIRENIAFGVPGASAGRLERAVEDAHFHRDLAEFPLGIDTVVGERGVTLSGGQKQRAALARALAIDAPILVLDDALSAVDSRTESAILANLRRIRRGRTVFIVAHRVSAVRDADRIIYLDEGRIAEQGTHDELVAAGGAYAALAHAQALEEEIEAME